MEFQVQQAKGLLARNSIFNLVGQVLPMLAGILTIPYIVRGLGNDGYGILSIAYMVLGYFSIFDLGLSRATVKFVAEHLSPDKIHKVPELVWTSLGLIVTLGFVGGIILAGAVPFAVTRFFKMPPSFVAEAKISLFILCASMPVILGNDALRGVLEAAQRFDLVNYVKVPGSVCFYLLGALAIPFGIGVHGIVLLLVLVRLVTACIYVALCLHIFPGLRSGFRFSRTAMRPLAVFGGWVMVSNITGPIFGYLERFLIASVLSVSMLTFYSAPFDLVSKAVIFPASIAPSLFPYFSFHGKRALTVVSDVTARSVKYLLFAMTPVTAVFVFFARDILQLWLGSSFAIQSTVVLQLLAISFFLNAFAYVPFTSVQALGRPDLKAILDAVALPAYALYSWWFMHRLGINGAALAKLVSAAIDAGFLFAFAWKVKAFSPRDCLKGTLFRALLASGGLLFVVFLVQSFNSHLITSLLLLTFCFVCYTGIFWFLAVDQQEKITITALCRQALSLLKRTEISATAWDV